MPACCFGEEAACVGEPDVDGLCVVDIELVRGVVAGIVQADVSRCHVKEGASVVYLNSSMCWPAMVDLHTHIGELGAGVGLGIEGTKTYRSSSSGRCVVWI